MISGKEFQANTICLPFDEKPNEKYLGAYVTVAGWGWVKNRKLLLWFIKDHVVNNLNTFNLEYWNYINLLKKPLIIIWKFIQNLFSGIELGNQLQKLVTKVMPYAKCQQAHKDYMHPQPPSPVLEANNVCAGGEKGIEYFLR